MFSALSVITADNSGSHTNTYWSLTIPRKLFNNDKWTKAVQNKMENRLMLELHITEELIWETCCNAKFDPCKQISQVWANIWLLIWTFQAASLLYKTGLDILEEQACSQIFQYFLSSRMPELPQECFFPGSLNWTDSSLTDRIHYRIIYTRNDAFFLGVEVLLCQANPIMHLVW